MPDDDGVIHVFEALITGVLVLTAVLFLTGLSAPSTSPGSGGIDLGRLAADTLAIMESREAECDEDVDPLPEPDPCQIRFENSLEEVVHLAMTGQTTQAEDFIAEVLPPGTRFLLRLDNGVEPITMLPSGSGPIVNPRGAQAAETFLLPRWQAHPDDPMAPADALEHGDDFDFSACSVNAPTGATEGPAGPWNAMWADANVGATDAIPAIALYGVWDCGGALFRVVPADGTVTDFPLYAIQMVVWPGA